jgi:hypothetical protein
VQHYRLRIGDFRVVDRVAGEAVTIIAINTRRDDAVYALAATDLTARPK